MKKRKPELSPKKAKDLRPVFARLVQVLDHCGEGWIKKGNPGSYTYLESAAIIFRGRPLWFGGVRMGKNYVSFHLMPVYACPALLKGISPQLKKRMQGKACFNFTSVDEELMVELEKLTVASATKSQSAQFLQQMNKG